jgi:hypothetical protein
LVPEKPDPLRDIVFISRTGALFPVYRTFSLLEQLTVALFRQSNEDADHHDVPVARSAHFPPGSAGIEPLARHVSGGNSGGNFLPTFSQMS